MTVREAFEIKISHLSAPHKCGPIKRSTKNQLTKVYKSFMVLFSNRRQAESHPNLLEDGRGAKEKGEAKREKS